MSSAVSTYYRKYRPRIWDEVAGQEIPKRILQNSLLRKNPAHAYMLCGPRGTGKTTSARIFAAALNCTQRQDANPCLQCPSCRGFHSGSYPDFMEMDAASNRKIDDFREIRDQVQYPPMAGKDFYKVYVIDEVHMLSKDAANSFLKTLEEPPAYMIFLLATTEPERLPPTILSRCIRLDFELLSATECESRLEEGLKAESLKIESTVLDQLYRRSGGGMRDALTLLEQTVQLCGPHVELSDYLKSMGLPTLEIVDGILEAHSKGVLHEIIQQYRELIRGGCTPQSLLELLLNRLRDYLAFHYNVNVPFQGIPQEAASRNADFWVYTFQAYLKILDSMRQSLYPELHGEMGLLLCSREPKTLLGSGPVSSQLDGKLAKLEQRISKMEKEPSQQKAAPVPVETRDLTLDRYPEAEKNWKLLLKDFKKKDRMKAAFFENATPRLEEDRLCLYYSPKFEFHYKKVQDPEATRVLQELVKTRFGDHRELTLILGDPPDSPTDDSETIKDYSPTVERNQEGDSFSEELQDKLLQDPGIRVLVDELGAVIKNVD
ncbi:DNA polymerase III subunit gamma/tau [bacterium]|nr:DNA polymerase III subunit gamma/tau [bacterium]